MQLLVRWVSITIFFCNTLSTFSQSITTVAGDGSYGSIDGPVLSASFKSPRGMTKDALGNLYVVDMDAHVIRKITSDGIVSTFAGTGVAGDAVGAPNVAQFRYPFDIVIDNQGFFYVTDESNNKIKKISPTGFVSDFIGNGTSGDINGNGMNARLNRPSSICIDANNNLVFTDTYNHKIKKATLNGDVITIAGNGVYGTLDGLSLNATFQYPQGIAMDDAGNFYVGSGSYTIKKIGTNGITSTFAGNYVQGDEDGQGTIARFNSISQIKLGPNNSLFVTEYSISKIKQVDQLGNVTTIISSSGYGSEDGSFTSSRFAFPSGIYFDGYRSLFFTEVDFRKIRKAYFPISLPCQLTVTNTNDSGVGSLRDCIECANVKPGKDTIIFLINDVLTNVGLPEITEALEIRGNVDSDGWPITKVRLSGINGWFGIDEGSTDAFIINSDSVIIVNLSIDSFYRPIWIKKNRTAIEIKNNIFSNFNQIRTDTIGSLLFENNNINVQKNGDLIAGYIGHNIFFDGSKLIIRNNQFGNIGYILLGNNVIFLNNLLGISKQNKKLSDYSFRIIGDNNIVKGNYFGNSRYGIELYLTYPKNNIIDSNTIGKDRVGNIHPVEYGMFIYGGQKNVISNNVISNFTERAFERICDTLPTTNFKTIFIKNIIVNNIDSLKFYLNDLGCNFYIYKPKILNFTSIDTQITIHGKSKANDTVEVFYVKSAFIESIDEYIGTTYSDQYGIGHLHLQRNLNIVLFGLLLLNMDLLLVFQMLSLLMSLL
ncbi:MAG: hypothetical protein MUE33_00565 [Cytophagaceae bacterium]|jgi:hypothetical protein|nr:hypothetical protein [Cytophagaceae bacterium]